MLERLIEIEKSATVRARYQLTAGFICRDELQRPDAAALHLRGALDDDPGLDRAALALEQLYVASGEWKELARFYRNALKRLGPESPEDEGDDGDGKNKERLRVWSQLGELCWDKLGERESALAALEVALTLDRNNLERHKQLADLYVQNGPSTFDKSIAAHQTCSAPRRAHPDRYRSLKHLYIQTGQREKAAACSYALPNHGEGDAERRRRGATGRRPGAAGGGRSPTRCGRGYSHPDEDRYLQALFSAVGPMLTAAQAQPHKTYNLVRKDAVDA